MEPFGETLAVASLPGPSVLILGITLALLKLPLQLLLGLLQSRGLQRANPTGFEN